MEHHGEADRHGVADAGQAGDFAQGFDASDKIETVGYLRTPADIEFGKCILRR